MFTRHFAKYCLFLLPALFISACRDDGNEQPVRQDRNVEVITHEVSLLADTNRIEAIGTARAKNFAIIYPRAGGEVTAVNFTAGDYVKAGAPLLELDAREERLAVRRAKITLKDAEQAIARYRKVDIPGAISQDQIDEARTALDAAVVDLELAEFALSERTVRAPFSGYVGLTEVDPGARITTQTAITRLDDRSVLYVDFDAPEQVFGRIGVGDHLPMIPFASGGRSYDSQVASIDTRIDPERRTFAVRTSIDNTSDNLRPGMSFRVTFELPGEAYPAIPEAAIIWGGDGAYLWAVEEGAATRISVSIIGRREGQVLVRAPLEEGDLIVAEGVQKVREGTAVSPRSKAATVQQARPGAAGKNGASGQ